MIICHCKAVRADEIRAEVRLGAEDTAMVGLRCGAGTGCGGCRAAVAEVIADELARAETAVLLRH